MQISSKCTQILKEFLLNHQPNRFIILKRLEEGQGYIKQGLRLALALL